MKVIFALWKTVLQLSREISLHSLCLETCKLHSGRIWPNNSSSRSRVWHIARDVCRPGERKAHRRFKVHSWWKRKKTGKRTNRCSVQTVSGVCFPKRKDPRWAFIRAHTRTQHAYAPVESPRYTWTRRHAIKIFCASISK